MIPRIQRPREIRDERYEGRRERERESQDTKTRTLKWEATEKLKEAALCLKYL
jgi:hypothetical protein